MTTLKNQAKRLTVGSLKGDETLQKDLKEWNEENSELKLMTEKEIDECACGCTLDSYIEESLSFMHEYMDSDEQFDLIFE